MNDHFKRWLFAIPITAIMNENIAKAIFKHWISEQGVPEIIVSDQGRELISKGTHQICRTMGTMKISTSGHILSGKSTVERFNEILNDSLWIVFDRSSHTESTEFLQTSCRTVHQLTNQQALAPSFLNKTGCNSPCTCNVHFTPRIDEKNTRIANSGKPEFCFCESTNAATRNVEKESTRHGTRPVQPHFQSRRQVSCIEKQQRRYHVTSRR